MIFAGIIPREHDVLPAIDVVLAELVALSLQVRNEGVGPSPQDVPVHGLVRMERADPRVVAVRQLGQVEGVLQKVVLDHTTHEVIQGLKKNKFMVMNTFNGIVKISWLTWQSKLSAKSGGMEAEQIANPGSRRSKQRRTSGCSSKISCNHKPIIRIADG